MFPTHYENNNRRRAYLRAFGLLMLMGLVACGAADQTADTNAANPAVPQQAPASPEGDPSSAAQAPTPPARPTAQLPTPALRSRPTATPALPQPIKPSVRPAAAPATPSSAGGWSSYRNAQDGWSIAYPPDWTIDERGGDDGPAITTVRPASGVGVSVGAQVGTPPAIQPSEKANIICTRVTVGRLSGNRCVDANKGTIATTLAGKGRTYVIATLGKGVDEQIYQRMLESFVAG